MTNISRFESRTGKLTCTAAELFNFTTDIRHFKRFIPEGSIKNWQATENSCTFQVPPLGNANVRIEEKVPFSKVVFQGDALQKNDFELVLQISENEKKLAGVKIILSASLNPVLRMMATSPIENFLEKLISEMEKMENWSGIK